MLRILNSMTGIAAFASRWGSARAGSVSFVFAFSILVLIGFIGFGVDQGRAVRTSQLIRAALDAAALAGAKAMIEENASDDAVRERTERVLRSQLLTSRLDESFWSNLQITFDRQEGRVDVTVDMSMPTIFMRLLAIDSVDAPMTGRAAYKITSSETALVLDITGSMLNNGKLPAMQAAAKEALQLLLPDGTPHFNRVAIAPYAATVNAGALAAAVSDGMSTDDCVVERTGAAAATDAAPNGADALKVQADTPPGPNPTFPPPDWRNGNVYECVDAPVVPLTNDKAQLEALIDSFVAKGGTAGHLGIAWGWYLLSPEWASLLPSSAQPKPYGAPDTTKSIVLMTDGMFNVSYLNGPLNETSRTQALDLCNNAKAAGVTIYTVGFAINALPPADSVAAEALLRDCASGVGMGKLYYPATNSADLTAAFKNIAGRIQALRLQ